MVTVCASYMGSHVHRIIVLLLLSHLMHIQFNSLQMHIESRLQRASHERAFNPHYVIFFLSQHVLIHAVEWFPWCGLLFNVKTLDVRLDYARYTLSREYYHVE